MRFLSALAVSAVFFSINATARLDAHEPLSCDLAFSQLFISPETYNDIRPKIAVLRQVIDLDTTEHKARRSYPFTAMGYISSNPWKAPRNSVAEKMYGDFIVQLEEPVTASNIAIRKRAEFETEKQTQCCRLAEGHFWSAGIAPKSSKEATSERFVAISLKGVDGVVGIQKFSGDKTFIATKTVLGPDGRPRLIAGGIYELDPTQRDILQAKFDNRDTLNPDPTPLHEELERLDVLPRRMIDPYSHSFPDEIFEEVLGAPRGDMQFIDRPTHRRLMEAFQRRLNEFRIEVETRLSEGTTANPL